MREIKFRAFYKRKMYKVEMINWSNTEMKYTKENYISIVIRKGGNLIADQIKRFKLMQYTGLKDRNGKEIYEGDIIEIDEKGYIVGWNEENVSFYLDNIVESEECSFNEFITDGFEVVGNIYENKELLI